MKIAAMSILGLGFVLLLLSGMWPTLFPATNSWTDEKAEHHSAIKVRRNDVAHLLLRPGNAKGPLQTEYDQLTKEDEELNAEFKSVTDKPQAMSKVMKWSGISLALVGIVGWYAVNQSR